jgi:alanine-glyoxylate transaminase/serine-glyoxylate transaminase/serine-pyruvate transaminase
MALCNSLGDGDELLVVSHGVFGDRFAAIARAHGWRCDVLSAEPGAAAAPDELARRLAGGRYRAVTVTHVDTSTGVLAPVEAYAPIVRRAGALLVLDGVCATGALPEPMEALGVDHLVTTSQKALGVPPGLTILGLSRRALARREELPRVPAYYADLANWVPIMRDPGGYFSTPPVNAVVALDRALAIIEEEGFEARHERHRRFAAAFRAGLAALGLETLTRADCLAPTLSVVRYPEGVDDGAFRAAAEAAGALFAGGVGPLRGRVFRVGHMGNIGRAELLTAIAAVEAGLSAAGHRVQPGLGVAAVQAALLR